MRYTRQRSCSSARSLRRNAVGSWNRIGLDGQADGDGDRITALTHSFSVRPRRASAQGEARLGAALRAKAVMVKAILDRSRIEIQGPSGRRATLLSHHTPPLVVFLAERPRTRDGSWTRTRSITVTRSPRRSCLLDERVMIGKHLARLGSRGRVRTEGGRWALVR